MTVLSLHFIPDVSRPCVICSISITVFLYWFIRDEWMVTTCWATFGTSKMRYQDGRRPFFPLLLDVYQQPVDEIENNNCPIRVFFKHNELMSNALLYLEQNKITVQNNNSTCTHYCNNSENKTQEDSPRNQLEKHTAPIHTFNSVALQTSQYVAESF